MNLLKGKVLNIPELQKIQRQILTWPDSFDMDRYARVSVCGTTLCIAGWALHNNGFTPTEIAEMPSEQAGETAAEILGLENKSAYNLFSETLWPHNFYLDYSNAEDGRGRAQAGAKMIDLLIRNNGFLEDSPEDRF